MSSLGSHSVGEVYGTQRPRRRWGRRLLITFIVLVIIVVGLLAVADRVAKSYAERVIGDKVSDQITQQKATSEKPDVTIEGFPFLTQVAGGNYQEIKIQLRDFTGPAANNKTIAVPLLDIRADDVKAPLDTLRSGNGDITASTVTGTATIAYSQVAELIDQPGLKLQERDGKLVGAAPVQALGQTYNVTGTAALTVKGGAVQVRFSDVKAAGLPDIPLVQNLVNSYAQKLALDLRVPPLPLKLTLQKVEAAPDGLKVTAGARDVPLNSGGL
jgi:hypothetical protein